MTVGAGVSSAIWAQAAEALGWRLSPAHDGWISDAHVDRRQYGEGGHPSGVCAEDACFMNGVETLVEAVSLIG